MYSDLRHSLSCHKATGLGVCPNHRPPSAFLSDELPLLFLRPSYDSGEPSSTNSAVESLLLLQFRKDKHRVMYLRFTSYLWRKYADYLYTKREKNILWEMVDPYRRPKSFTPLVTAYIAAFYTGVIAAAITEQLYKEKYWEEHPGKEVPLMRPKFYGGPWRVYRGEALPPDM